MHQMQLSYISTEDRMLFRINTNARQEFRFWMTRRYTGILWTTLSKLLEGAIKGQPQDGPPKPIHDSLVKSAEQELKHQEVVSQSDFQTGYQENTYLPLGEEPALLFSVAIKPNPDAQAMLCLHPENGQGVEIVLNEQIVHSLCKLIADTTNKAGWNLDLSFGESGTTPEPPAGLN